MKLLRSAAIFQAALLLDAHRTSHAAELQAGPMLGHTTATEAQIWVKADAPAQLGIRLSKSADDLAELPQIDAVRLTAVHGFTGTGKVSGLEPATRYHYQITLDGKPAGGPSSFTTAGIDGEPGHLRFAFTSCLGRAGAEAAGGWAEMAAKADVDLVLLLGDNHYADTTARAGQTAAYLDHRAVPGFRDIAPRVPIYAIWDDHDFGPNDSDGTAKGKEQSLATFEDFWANPAYGEADNPGIYYQFSRAGVDFFMLDDRYHRSPDKAPQDGTKTMLGARQLAWLRAGLKASKAKLKIVASGSEFQMNGHRDSWTSYARERADILDFIKSEPITGVVFISGDRHFTGGYQIRGEVVEITSGPLGSKNYPTENLPEMFMNHGEGKMYSVFDIDTKTTPDAPKVILEVHRAGAGIIDKRELSWPHILGEKKFDYLPVPEKRPPEPAPGKAKESAVQDPKDGHPRPSYAGYSDEEMKVLTTAVRKSRPAMHRGGWEWDRLLTRYVDGGRKQNNELLIVRAYFMSILDRYEEAVQAGEGDKFTLFYNHRSWGSGGRMRIFAELVKQKMLTKDEQKTFEEIVLQSLKVDFEDYSMLERGVNNRPYGINGGPAIAVKMFPEHPNSKRHKPWLEALWRELREYGDTTETNYYPYGPLYLLGLLDMAEGMGKLQDTAENFFLFHHALRYLFYIHGGGVRGNPNSGVRINNEEGAREKIYADPWNARYFVDEAGAMDADVWYRFAKLYESPEFLWASEQVCLGGRPPEGIAVPAEYMEAYKKRYFWFIERGIDPQVPDIGSAIGYYSPLKHKVPERLYLCPSRESGKPFASFFIYDRNNNYMHYCDDSDGKLYEYCVDGAKFLHTSGKYTSGRAGVGETAYDMLSVLPPDMKFPIKEGGGMDTPTGEAWKMASMSIKVALPSREGPDSTNWKFDESIGKFRRADQPDLGFSYGNMDGYWYLNNDFHLNSLRIGNFPAGALVQNIRLAGPKGEKILAAFDTLPDDLIVELIQGDQRAKLEGRMREASVEIVDSGRRGGKCLKVGDIGDGNRLAITLKGLDEKFDGQDEYTRMSYDFKAAEGGSLTPNVRTMPRYFTPLWHRGAILVRDDLRAENADEDSFGQFTMRNYYGANSKWTRQTVLTAEGYLVVRDRYVPCSDVDGYNAAPCWSIKAEEGAKSGKNWFDAPARDHAWWQTQKKRVLLYLHQGDGLSIGQVEHRTSQDIGGGNVRNSFAKAKLEAGQPQVWLSVLRPFNEGQDAAGIAAHIETKLDEQGNAKVNVGKVTIMISGEAEWTVKR